LSDHRRLAFDEVLPRNETMNRRRFLATSLAVPATLAAGESTPSPSSELLRFGVITDAQYADADPQGERHYRATPEKLKAAVADLAQRKLPFTLHLGDFIDRNFGSFATLLPLLDGLGHPVRHLLGNHDYSVADGEKCRIVSTLGLPHDYYAFRTGRVRFLMLDTNALGTYKTPAITGLTSGPNGVDAKQLAWLDRELAASDLSGDIVLVCGHHPLTAPLQLANAGEVLGVLAKHRSVKAYLNGHHHDGAYGVHEGIHCVTFRSILHRPETNAWSVARVFPDRLLIEGFGREESRELKFRA
jgi:manganese-dependent ADP-ribose/CDP-alcohol diphosphatase